MKSFIKQAKANLVALFNEYKSYDYRAMVHQMKPEDVMRCIAVFFVTMLFSAEAMAQTTGTVLPGVANLVCDVTSTIRGPYLFGGGLALLTLGGVSIAASESTIFKLMSSGMMGLGVAAAGLPLLTAVGITTGCSGLTNT